MLVIVTRVEEWVLRLLLQLAATHHGSDESVIHCFNKIMEDKYLKRQRNSFIIILKFKVEGLYLERSFLLARTPKSQEMTWNII